MKYDKPILGGSRALHPMGGAIGPSKLTLVRNPPPPNWLWRRSGARTHSREPRGRPTGQIMVVVVTMVLLTFVLLSARGVATVTDPAAVGARQPLRPCYDVPAVDCVALLTTQAHHRCGGSTGQRSPTSLA
jgi:hypothetical protein